MFQAKYRKIIVGVMLVFLLAICKLYMSCNGGKLYLLHEEVEYISPNPSAGRVNYTSNDNLLSEFYGKTNIQKPKEVKQGIIIQQSKEVKQSVNKEPVEDIKQSVSKEPVEDIKQSVSKEPVEDIKQSVSKEPVEDIKQSVSKEPVEDIKQSVNKESVEDVKRNVNTEPVEEVKQSVLKEPVEKVKQSDKTQLPGNINQDNKNKQLLPAETSNPLQHLANLTGPNKGGVYHSYLRKLSTSQINSVINQLGVTNLTLQKSQMKFLSCGAKRLLKQLKAKQLNSSVHMSSSFHHCKNMSFKSSGPSVALASFPGSGNSWVRQLLESATGIYTGAIYCDLAYVGAGMIGEFIDTNNVLVIKTHLPPSMSLLAQYNKAIYVVRNPLNAILAEHNRALAAGAPKLYGDCHTAEVNYKYVNNPAWDREVKQKVQGWKTHITQWLKVTAIPVLVVGFENLKNDTYTELKKILDFLGHPYSEDSVMCAIKSPSESFHRNHTKDSNAFSPGLRQSIVNDTKQINANLLKHNISFF